MTPQELKNSILQLAIQGKLVEQRPEEGTAEELYQQIQAEKQKLIREGKIKKEKPLPEITEEEKPFDIPESWKSFRLGELVILLSGTDFPPERYNEIRSGIPYITGASSLSDNGVLLNRWTETPSIIAQYGDVLLVCKGSGYGKTVICDTKEAHIARQIMAIKNTPSLEMNYVRYYLQANLIMIRANGQGVIPGVDRKSVLCMAFPLPPLAEQKRIVAKIEELLPLIDRYEKAYNRLEELNKRFPDDLQKSLLQMAIQGKLVEQRPEEGTGEQLYEYIQREKKRLIDEGNIKKEKQLPKITEEEKHFDIPESWIWIRLGSVVNNLFAGGDKPSDFTEHFDETRRYPVIANGIKNDGILGFTARPTAKARTITVAGRGNIGFSLFREYEYCPIDRLIVIEQNQHLHPQYLQKVLEALPEKSLGTSIPQLTVPMLMPKLIPLPPFAEQKRIVAKLEELLPLCEKMKGKKDHG